MKTAKHVTLMIVPEGSEARRGIRLPVWIFRAAVVTFGLVVVGIILFFVFYGQMLSRVAMTNKISEENQMLRRYRYKVQLLENNLYQAREMVGRLAKIAGVTYEFPALPDDSELFAKKDTFDSLGNPLANVGDRTMPKGLPVRGFVSQAFNTAGSSHFHPGVDIACAVGTPVLVTGPGEVVYADYDSTYGYMVVVKHNDSVTTVYGHNDKILVYEGQEVDAGTMIALTGNTGKSTAPHLHYELRINDEPVNPMGSQYDKENLSR